MIGRPLSHYLIREKPGRGRMSVIDGTQDTHLKRLAAVKPLPAKKVANAERKRRSIREAKCVPALDLPDIVKPLPRS